MAIIPFGYTGHSLSRKAKRFGKHIEGTGFINMKARIYDPATCRFLSPDPYISDPEYVTAYNRYAYCLNNPLSYVDPSGENPLLIAVIVGAVIGGASYTVSIALSDGGFNNWNWGDFLKSVGLGAVSGVATYGVGVAFGAVGNAGFLGEIGRAFAHGYSQGIISGIGGGGFMTGFASGSLGSLGGSFFMMHGGQFASSTVGNLAFSGLAGGIGSELTGGDFWQGAGIGLMTAGLNHLQQGLSRPKFEDLVANYPTDPNDPMTDMIGEEVYNLIGGEVLAEHVRDPKAYRNACALRTSRALNYAGTKIPNISGQTLVGADGKNYFYRASDLYRWMSKPAVFGKPNISSSNATDLNGSKGIYIMQAHYPRDFGAWGHATLYIGNRTIGHSYIGSYAYKYYLWNF